MRRASLLLGLAALLALAACASDDAADKSKEGAGVHDDARESADARPAKDKTLPLCPQVAIVRELDTYNDYGGEPPAPGQLVAKARMNGVEGACEFRDDGIDMTFDLKMTALRGPRLGGLRATAPFFVALVDPEGRILGKNRLTTGIEFSSGDKLSTYAESLHVFLPLAKADRATAPGYQVLMGFQLTEGQLGAMKTQSP